MSMLKYHILHKILYSVGLNTSRRLLSVCFFFFVKPTSFFQFCFSGVICFIVNFVSRQTIQEHPPVVCRKGHRSRFLRRVMKRAKAVLCAYCGVNQTKKTHNTKNPITAYITINMIYERATGFYLCDTLFKTSSNALNSKCAFDHVLSVLSGCTQRYIMLLIK